MLTCFRSSKAEIGRGGATFSGSKMSERYRIPPLIQLNSRAIVLGCKRTNVRRETIEIQVVTSEIRKMTSSTKLRREFMSWKVIK